MASARDRLIRDAVIRNLDIIGEASSRLSSIVTADDAVPWRRIKAFRNVPVHDYSGIDMSIVWQVIEKDLPPLVSHVDRLLADPDRR